MAYGIRAGTHPRRNTARPRNAAPAPRPGTGTQYVTGTHCGAEKEHGPRWKAARHEIPTTAAPDRRPRLVRQKAAPRRKAPPDWRAARAGKRPGTKSRRPPLLTADRAPAPQPGTGAGRGAGRSAERDAGGGTARSAEPGTHAPPDENPLSPHATEPPPWAP
ncbi:hypothetical protein GCM10010508_69260 [Streptomyces naganishii JCM 4654]|uniref:Uncharacterized protein n=1 Tax=Streptomyces naganishii JCM 4654 TaxID=1306179 RepID=A0A918YBY2_9ACTN|nr:hypothetical protein GCM10010508_69260 [Streptomyces naganishii JCM 4654]